MQIFRKIPPERLDLNPFAAIGNDWMLIAAPDGKGGANPMTASWGGMGVLWARPVAFIFLRPQRYTRELTDAGAVFSLNFFDANYRPQLGICGSKSGRDVDKIAQCGFDLVTGDSAPYFAQAHTAILCKKLYRQPLEPGLFLDPAINGAHYAENDHHILYVGEIESVLLRGDERLEANGHPAGIH